MRRLRGLSLWRADYEARILPTEYTENMEMNETSNVETGLTIGEICKRAYDTAEAKGFHEAQGKDGHKFPTFVMMTVEALGRAVEADRQGDEPRKRVMLEHADCAVGKLLEGDMDGTPVLFGTQAMLMVTEIVEAVGGYHAGDMANVAEEFADLIIRLADTALQFDLDLEAAILAKLAQNEGRPHLHGGKKY